MRRTVAVLLALAVTTGAVTAATPAAEPPPERQQKLLYLLKQDCGSCHGLTLKGGLGPALLPEALKEKPDDMLVATILHGRPGTPMPPWAFEVSEAEAHWLIRRLREGDTNG